MCKARSQVVKFRSPHARSTQPFCGKTMKSDCNLSEFFPGYMQIRVSLTPALFGKWQKGQNKKVL